MTIRLSSILGFSGGFANQPSAKRSAARRIAENNELFGLDAEETMSDKTTPRTTRTEMVSLFASRLNSYPEMRS
jgi:hypothetical protein